MSDLMANIEERVEKLERLTAFLLLLVAPPWVFFIGGAVWIWHTK